MDVSEDGSAATLRLPAGASGTSVRSPLSREELLSAFFIHPSLPVQCDATWIDSDKIRLSSADPSALCGRVLATAFSSGDVWLRKSRMKWDLRFESSGSFEVRLCSESGASCESVRERIVVRHCADTSTDVEEETVSRVEDRTEELSYAGEELNASRLSSRKQSVIASALVAGIVVATFVLFATDHRRQEKEQKASTAVRSKDAVVLSPQQKKIVDREISSYPPALRRLFSEDDMPVDSSSGDTSLSENDEQGGREVDASTNAVAARLRDQLRSKGITLSPSASNFGKAAEDRKRRQKRLSKVLKEKGYTL